MSIDLAGVIIAPFNQSILLKETGTILLRKLPFERKFDLL